MTQGVKRPFITFATETGLATEYSYMKGKHSFFILVDDGSSQNGILVRAYSREQINQIFDLPRSKWITVMESGFEDHPLYELQMKHSGAVLTFDVDNPTGPLEYYMQKNKVMFAGAVGKSELDNLAEKFDRK